MASIHDPYTLTLAESQPDHGRANAYICYASIDAPTNGAGYGPGIGSTPKAACLAATYWANQSAHVRVVPISKAPRWAIEEAEQRDQ